jgi:hypothetical protein
VQTARDPAARRTAAAMGRDHAGLELGRFRPEAVSPELAGLALSVAAADPAVFEALERRLGETEDPALRLRLLEALGAATAPALSRRALSLVADPRLRPEERVEPLAAQAARPETRAAAFESLRGHYHLVAGDASAASRLPQLASGFCDRARAAEVQAFFRPRAARLPGGERRVDRVVERIELCAALRESQAASAAAWFAGR